MSKMEICVYVCPDECIVSECCEFGGIGMKMVICLYLCSDECTMNDCCKMWFQFGRKWPFVFKCVPMKAL